MILKAADGVSFELHVVGYQFPDDHVSQYDSNWLNIRIDVTHPLGGWSRTDPALLRYEVQRLAHWLHALGSGEHGDAEQSFLEPNLAFELLKDAGETLRISFRLEFSPPRADRWTGEDRLYVDFPLVDVDLEAAASSLLEELSRYPKRASR